MLFPVVINMSSWQSYFPQCLSKAAAFSGRDADPTLERAKANPNQREAKTVHILGECWQGAGAGLAEGGHSADSVSNEPIWTLLTVLACRVPLAVLQWKETEWWMINGGAAWFRKRPFSWRPGQAEGWLIPDLDLSRSSCFNLSRCWQIQVNKLTQLQIKIL